MSVSPARRLLMNRRCRNTRYYCLRYTNNTPMSPNMPTARSDCGIRFHRYRLLFLHHYHQVRYNQSLLLYRRVLPI